MLRNPFSTPGKDYCVLNVDSLKDSVKNRDNLLFVPMVKCILQECGHLLSGLTVLPDILFVGLHFTFRIAEKI